MTLIEALEYIYERAVQPDGSPMRERDHQIAEMVHNYIEDLKANEFSEQAYSEEIEDDEC